MEDYRTVALVDENLCTGCQSCLSFCPVDAIIIRKGVAKVLGTFCNGCGYCEDCCGEEAIKMTHLNRIIS